MPATNSTTHYELPIFIGTDKPSWMGDWNGAMNKIDAALAEIAANTTTAVTTANAASTTAQAAQTAVTALSGRVTDVETAQTGMSQDIQGNTSEITALETQFQQLQSQLDTLGSIVDNLPRDNNFLTAFICQGSAGGGAPSGAIKVPCTQVEGKLSLTIFLPFIGNNSLYKSANNYCFLVAFEGNPFNLTNYPTPSLDGSSLDYVGLKGWINISGYLDTVFYAVCINNTSYIITPSTTPLWIAGAAWATKFTLGLYFSQIGNPSLSFTKSLPTT